MRSLTHAVVMVTITVVSAGMSRADEAAAPDLRAAVAAAWTEFDAGHWPESTAGARTVLARLRDDEPGHHALRGDLLRLLAEAHQADAADAVAAYDAALAAGSRDAAVLEGKGRALRLLDRTAEAVARFDEVLALRPDHADTLEARGLARMALWENDAALADLARAVKLAPASAKHRIALASMHRRLGDVPAATAALEEAVKLAKGAGDDCGRGEALAELRRYREAVEAQTAAIDRDKRNRRAQTLRSVAHAKKHDPQAAVADAREIARLDPGDAGHWLRIGTIERDDLHDAAAALKSFDRGLEIAPRNVELLVARGRLKFGGNDYQAAIADLDAAAAVNPHALDVLTARAELHSRRREFKETVACYDRLLAVVPRNPFTLSDRAVAYRSLGDVKQALADCDAALAIVPPRDHATRARIQLAAQRWPELIEAYTQAIAADPGNAQLLHERAWVYNETRDHEKAAADCRAGLAIDPEDSDLQKEMAYALKGLGDHDAAIAFFTKLIDRNPNGDAGLYEYRGDAHTAKKDHAAARADYERACALAPLVPQRWTSFGKACEAGGDLDKALACFDEAIRLEPDRAHFHRNRASLLRRQEKYADAIAAYDRSITIEPNFANGFYWRGKCRERQNDLDGAEADFVEAVRLAPKDSANKKALEELHTKRILDPIRALEKAGDSAGIVAVVDRVLAEAEKAFADSPASMTAVLDVFIRAHASLGQAAQAEALHERALALHEKSFGPDDPHTVRRLEKFARFYRDQRQYAQAEPLYKRLLAVAEKSVGLDHPDITDELWELAELYKAQGRYDQAAAMGRRVLTIRETTAEPDAFSVSLSLLFLGDVYFKQRDFAQATPIFERLLANTEKQSGPDHPDTAKGLDGLAALYQLQAMYARAEPLLKRALAIREKSLGPDHPDTATSLNSLASVYKLQGQYAQAEPLVKRAVAICEKSSGPDDPVTASSLTNLSLLYEAQGLYAQAEPLLKRALAIREKALGLDHPDTATSLNNLAALFQARGEYAQAKPLLKRALAIRERALGPDHPLTAESLNNLAKLHESLGQYAQAEPLLQRALAIREKALGPDHPETATSLNNLAKLFMSQGQSAQAESLLKRALAIREKALGPDHPDTAASLNNLAFLYDSQRQYAQAEPLYKRAIAICEKALGPDHPLTATSLNNLAQLSMSQGQSAQAEPLLKRALAIREKALGPDHPLTAESLNNLAQLHESLGQYAEAEPLYQRAVAIHEKTLGPDHPHTATIMNNQGAIHVVLGRFPDAVRLFDRVRRGTRRHVARVLPSLPDAEQAVFLRTQHQDAFHAALTLGLLQKSSPQVASLSAGWLANGKAVAQEAASQRIILARQSANPAAAAAVAALERARADLATLSQVTPSPDEATSHRTRLAALQAEEQRLVHEIGGQIAAMDRQEPWLEIDAIRKNISAGGVLVDIARFGIIDFNAQGKDAQWQPARYAAWIVPPAGKGDVTIVDLGPAEEIDAAVAAYREAIEAAQKGGFKRGQATAEEELKVTAAPLSQKVLQPIADAVGDATEVIVSPDGALWLLPWQALPLADGTYAIEKFAIRTVTSARDLVPVPVEAKGGKGGSIVAADPAFDAAPAASGTSAADATRSFAPASGIERRFSRLPGTRAEVSATKPALAKLTGGAPTMLLGADASETNIKRSAVRPAALVLATHGFFKPDQVVKKDDKAAAQLAGMGSRGMEMTRAVTTTGEALEDPLLRCGLALAGANVGAKADGGDDGILTGAEIVGLDLLGTDLVVLSACETGVGKVQNGEGVAGLRQAFQIAGAKSVVATLWQVPDAESAQIMAAFYANLAQGQPPSQALRAAQLAFIKARREDRNYEAAHPYLWAAYGVTGR